MHYYGLGGWHFICWNICKLLCLCYAYVITLFLHLFHSYLPLSIWPRTNEIYPCYSVFPASVLSSCLHSSVPATLISTLYSKVEFCALQTFCCILFPLTAKQKIRKNQKCMCLEWEHLSSGNFASLPVQWYTKGSDFQKDLFFYSKVFPKFFVSPTFQLIKMVQPTAECVNFAFFAFFLHLFTHTFSLVNFFFVTENNQDMYKKLY